jgi:hypothetical protein
MIEPPQFDNDWIPVFLMYGYGIFLMMWRVTIMGQCQRARRPLSLKEHLKIDRRWLDEAKRREMALLQGQKPVVGGGTESVDS